MHPFFSFFGREIPAYGLMMLLSAALSVGILYIRARMKKYPAEDGVFLCLIAVCGALVGGWLLYAATVMPGIIGGRDAYFAGLGFFDTVIRFFALTGGIVFYGGLIGGVAAMALYCRAFRVPLLPYADLMAPIMPITHAIGRVGCLLGGCCYGIEVPDGHPLGIIYPKESLAAPPGVTLLAAPLIEAGCNAVIAAALFLFSRKNRVYGRVTALYGMMYAVARFILEFFRGDVQRGVFYGISTSQVISVLVFALSAALFAFAPRFTDGTNRAWDAFLKKQERIK